jgi:four helix bundle protein
MVQNYRDLIAWQKAMDIAEAVFAATKSFPDGQKYVLTSQMQRSAVSIPSNIAEGRSRHSRNDFIYHLNVARGSLAELETQIILSRRLKFMKEDETKSLLEQCNEVTRVLFGLRDSLNGSHGVSEPDAPAFEYETLQTYNLTPVTCNLQEPR